MTKITFEHGGLDYVAMLTEFSRPRDITLEGGKKLSSGLVMYPLGHARSTSAGLDNILAHKNKLLGDLVFSEAGTPDNFVGCLQSMESLSATVMVSIFNFDLAALLEHPCIFHVFGEGAPRRLTDLQPFYGAASHREDARW